MKWIKWIGILAALLLVVSCFTPWVIIPYKNIIVSGIDTTGTRFGKPGYFHIVLAVIYILFSLIQQIWTKRANLMIAGLNIAWVVRNYIIITACYMGECPERQSGLYITLIASVIMLLASFFPDMKLKEDEKTPVE